MKLQRTTLVLLFTAIALGGLVYFGEIQGENKREAIKTIKQPIFAFREEQIQSLTIYMDEETLEFERVSGKTIGWQMKTPKDVPASNATISFLLNLLVQGKSDRSFPIKPSQFSDYGLNKPTAVISVKLKNQQTHQLILGKPDFNRSFLYAQADPSVNLPNSWRVLLVPIDFEYAVNRPLSEWQGKLEKPEKSENPTKASPTPSVSPKPSPSPKASSTPTPTPSPKDSSTPSPKPTVTPSASPTPAPASGR